MNRTQRKREGMMRNRIVVLLVTLLFVLGISLPDRQVEASNFPQTRASITLSGWAELPATGGEENVVGPGAGTVESSSSKARPARKYPSLGQAQLNLASQMLGLFILGALVIILILNRKEKQEMAIGGDEE